MKRVFPLIFLFVAACGAVPPEEATAPVFLAPGSPAEQAVVSLVNDPSVDGRVLDELVPLDARAVYGIMSYRVGPDGKFNTDDDVRIPSAEVLEELYFVGPSAMRMLLGFALENGYWPDFVLTETVEEAAVLAVVNDRRVTVEILDDVVGLDARGAAGIHSFMAGPDGELGTPDDRRFKTLAELTELPFVGETGTRLLVGYAALEGYLGI